MADKLSDLLDERRGHIDLLADWHRRWNAAYAERYGADRDPMGALDPLDDAARKQIRPDHGAPILAGGLTQPD
jgi:hypothetical protein